MKNLVIVESPNKIKALEKYLGNNYIIKASVGHIVKLPSSGPHGFGVDLETWIPNYKIDPSKKKIIKEIKKELNEVNKVYIATDPDREGEAIGDNLVSFLDIKDKYYRIRFNEITKIAIENAIKNPQKLDLKLVNSQIARRILDRIIGYKLSKIMQTKIKNSPTYPSAGRVQSIALKLVFEREKLIKSFVSTKYKVISAKLENNLVAIFYLKNGKFKNNTWVDESQINEIKSKFSNELIIKNIEIKKKKEKKIIPFKQSTLYKKGNSSIGMSASVIQNTVQRLYEGYGEGGLISYPRTDSTRLSNTFVNHAKEYILNKYGEEYLSDKILGISGDQDAHEAIRPTSIKLTPKKAKIKFDLNNREYKLYKLIWENTMKSLMKVPIRENINYKLSELDLLYKLSYSKIIFDGYYKVVEMKEIDSKKEIKIPKFNIGDKFKVKKYNIEDKETQPPSRYNDGSLIKTLDDIKVGRPSTFASIIRILKKRFYVDMENKAMKITDFGNIVYKKLIEGFPKFMNEEYTAMLEKDLNEIAKGKKDYKEMLTIFWNSFEKQIEKQIEKTQVTIIPLEKSDKLCPKCNSNLVVRTNKRDGNKFLGCPKFPKCKHAEPKPGFEPKFIKKNFKKNNKK